MTYRPDASPEERRTAADEVDADVAERFGEIDAQLLSVPLAGEQELKAASAELEREDPVLSADLNYLSELQFTPNDPLFGRQWGLRRIFAPFAWNTTAGWYPNGNSTAIGILDSGIQNEHPDLQGAIVAEYDYFNFDPSAEDNVGHGTHVAGIAGASTHNGRGVAGTSPGALLIDAKSVRRSVARMTPSCRR